MQHQHRAAIGAGFGILAIAGMAASGAFACTRSGSLTNGTSQASVAAPGQAVTVTSTSYQAPGVRGNGSIDVQWVLLEANSQPRVLSVLASLTAPGKTTSANGTSVTFDADGKTTITFLVPADARPLPGGQSYYVRAVQNVPGYDPLNAAVPVIVPGDYIPELKETQTETQTTEDAGKPGFKAQDVGDNRSEVPSIAGAVPNAAVAAAERKAAPPVGQSGPSAPQVAEVGGAPGVPNLSPVSNDDPSQPQTADPAEFQLWSGLKASASPNSLLDGPQSAPTSSGNAAGVILLTMGGLALAGTGAAVGRRRLVLAKAARR